MRSIIKAFGALATLFDFAAPAWTGPDLTA